MLVCVHRVVAFSQGARGTPKMSSTTPQHANEKLTKTSARKARAAMRGEGKKSRNGLCHSLTFGGRNCMSVKRMLANKVAKIAARDVLFFVRVSGGPRHSSISHQDGLDLSC